MQFHAKILETEVMPDQYREAKTLAQVTSLREIINLR